MTYEELLDLNDEIAERKTENAQLEGERKALLQQFVTDWSCGTIEKAIAKSEELKAGIEADDIEIEQGLTALEEKYAL